MCPPGPCCTPAAMGELREADVGSGALRLPKTVGQRRVPVEEFRELCRRRRAGSPADESRGDRCVVKGQHVQPGPVQHMVDGRLLVGVRPRGKRRTSCACGLDEGPCAFEVAGDECGAARFHAGGLGQMRGEEASSAGSVEDEIDRQRWLVTASAAESQGESAGGGLEVVDRRFFKHLHTGVRGPIGEEGVDVGAQPVRVRDAVLVARGHEEPRLVQIAVAVGVAGSVGVEGEAAFEAVAQVGQGFFPASVGCQRIEIFEVPSSGEPLQRQGAQRCR